jgi:catechol 2,3-dioxygenase-like lactoylglutathione lyase family enzyme
MRYRLGLVMLYTRDVPRLRAFYVDKLGLEPVPQLSSEDFVFLSLAGGSPIALADAAALPPGASIEPGGAELSLEVDDVDAAYQDWRAKGLDVLTDVDDMGAGRVFYGQDPDGRRLNVHQLYQGTRDIRQGQGGA